LARDEKRRGQGFGDLLLADAIRRILSASEEIAVFAIIVDAKNDAASQFYQSFGFTPFPSNPKRLFMLTTTAVAAIGQI
jgi:ribosomal protein S18 acetylase RimI-like enzyme